MARTRRPGYTILELIVVLAILIMLGAVLIPSLTGFQGNTKQTSAADIMRTRLAEARAKAMELGVPMRVAVNQDKTRIKVAPDVADQTGNAFDSMQAANPPGPDAQATEDKVEEGVTLELAFVTSDDPRTTPTGGGWLTVATIKANGDTREAAPVTISVSQKGFPPILIQVHGLTGQTRTLHGQEALDAQQGQNSGSQQ